MVKFIHLRDRNSYNNTINPKGGATIAYQLTEDNKFVTFAFAECHPKDSYNKKQGRLKATKKLESPSQAYTLVYEGQRNREIVQILKERYIEILEQKQWKLDSLYQRALIRN